MTELVVSVIVGTVVVWACVRYGDWRTVSEGGDEKLLLFTVVVAVVFPAVLLWRLVHGLPLVFTARRREPGAWMTPVPHVEERELETRSWFFYRQTTIHHHWWIALYPGDGDTGGAPAVVLEVSKRTARRLGAHPRVAVYGHRRFGRRAVMAVSGRVVWPRSQDWVLPARTSLS